MCSRSAGFSSSVLNIFNLRLLRCSVRKDTRVSQLITMQYSAKFDGIFKANTGSMLALTLVVLVSFKLLTHLLPGRFGPVLENC